MKLDKEIIRILRSSLLDEFNNPRYDVIAGAIAAGIEGRAKNVQSAIEVSLKECDYEE